MIRTRAIIFFAVVLIGATLAMQVFRRSTPPSAPDESAKAAPLEPVDDADDDVTLVLPVTLTAREQRLLLTHTPLPEAPRDETNAHELDPAAAAFGHLLFFETNFSADETIACGSCHEPDRDFTDGLQLAEAIGVTERHTPALWNVAHQRWFFWDGRTDTLWAQALDPIENPVEHGFTRVGCVRVVVEDPVLRDAYTAIFGPLPAADVVDGWPAAARPVRGEPDHPHHRAWAGMTTEDQETVNRVFANLGKSIAAYERRLVRARAPFDVFAEGLREGDATKLDAMSPAALRGFQIFAGRGNCRNCHLGPAFSDGEFHSTGIGPLGGGELFDAGRYEGIDRLRASAFNAAGAFSDRRDGAAAEKLTSLRRDPETWGQFKTPTLRNVARTAPYMHQGQLATLEDVLRHYSTLEDAVLPSHHQEQLLEPVNLTPDETSDLIAFLEALTGEIAEPALLELPKP